MGFLRSAKPAALLLAAATAAALLTGCNADQGAPIAGDAASGSSTPSTSPTPSDPVAISANVTKGERDVPVDRLVDVKASGGRLQDVSLTGGTATVLGTTPVTSLQITVPQ